MSTSSSTGIRVNVSWISNNNQQLKLRAVTCLLCCLQNLELYLIGFALEESLVQSNRSSASGTISNKQDAVGQLISARVYYLYIYSTLRTAVPLSAFPSVWG